MDDRVLVRRDRRVLPSSSSDLDERNIDDDVDVDRGGEENEEEDDDDDDDDDGDDENEERRGRAEVTVTPARCLGWPMWYAITTATRWDDRVIDIRRGRAASSLVVTAIIVEFAW